MSVPHLQYVKFSTPTRARPLADYSEWRAEEYLDTYYREAILPDERRVLTFELDALTGEHEAFGRALEYGCGPTLHRAIAAARHVFRIDMADRVADNLLQIERWLKGGRESTDWSRFTRFVLEHEHGSAEQHAIELSAIEPPAIERREALARKVIRQLRLSDARCLHPLGPEREGFYDLLISGFCIDAVSGDKRVWRQCTANVLSMLRPGGLLVLHALHRCRAYRVADRLFPCTDLTADDLFDSLLANGIRRSSIDIQLAACPENAPYGYAGILMARGRKR